MEPKRGDPLDLWIPVVALTVLAGWTEPAWSSYVSLACPFKALSGLPCPTCGGTRAFVAAVSGNLRAAISWNPVVGAAAGMLLPGLAVAAGFRIGGWPRPGRLRGAGSGWRRALPALLALAIAANWAYLIVAGV